MDTESKKPTEPHADEEEFETRAEVTIEVTSDDLEDADREEQNEEENEEEEEGFDPGTISTKNFLNSIFNEVELMTRFLETIWPEALEQLDEITADPVAKNVWQMHGILDSERMRVANLQALTLLGSTVGEDVREAVVNKNLPNAIDAVSHLLYSNMLTSPLDTSSSLVASANFNVIYHHSITVGLASEATDARVRFLTSLESTNPDDRFHAMMLAGFDDAIATGTLIPDVPANYMN